MINIYNFHPLSSTPITSQTTTFTAQHHHTNWWTTIEKDFRKIHTCDVGEEENWESNGWNLLRVTNLDLKNCKGRREGQNCGIWGEEWGIWGENWGQKRIWVKSFERGPLKPINLMKIKFHLPTPWRGFITESSISHRKINSQWNHNLIRATWRAMDTCLHYLFMRKLIHVEIKNTNLPPWRGSDT